MNEWERGVQPERLAALQQRIRRTHEQMDHDPQFKAQVQAWANRANARYLQRRAELVAQGTLLS